MSLPAATRLSQLQAQLRRLPALLFHQQAPIATTRPFTSTAAHAMTKQPKPTTTPPTSADAFLDAIAHRHSIYGLTNTPPVSDATLAALLRRAVINTPSAFNSQSQRTALLLHDQHTSFWNLAYAALDATTSDKEKVARAKKRIDGFGAAAGTVLFFESGESIAALKEKAAAYADLVPGWSEHASGMLQIAVWTAFEAAGCGANLQHYNYEPEVERRAKDALGLPAHWQLKAQLVFGGVAEGAWPTEGKEKLSTDETVKVFGADV